MAQISEEQKRNLNQMLGKKLKTCQNGFTLKGERILKFDCSVSNGGAHPFQMIFNSSDVEEVNDWIQEYQHYESVRVQLVIVSDEKKYDAGGNWKGTTVKTRNVLFFSKNNA